MSMEMMSVEAILRNRISMLEKTMLAYDRRMNTLAVDADRKRILELENALIGLLPMIEENDPETLPAIERLLAKKICPQI
ncbi:hypothetical protein [Burkholderia ubonensis]|uniref:hypothetical protein n=1 Tax=Burkholderia ubonensis TaxID=101571 RepID=UPI0012F8D1B4|nr:hypothetical protein [Burkholderia ubonensis]